MVDAVTSQTILDGDRLAILKFTNISDGTGETAVVKINVANLAPNQFGLACNGCIINRVWASTQGMAVNILWEATANVLAYTIPTDTFYDMPFDSFGGIKNNSGAGSTGNIAFTTIGAGANDSYSIILEVIKTYASA